MQYKYRNVGYDVEVECWYDGEEIIVKTPHWPSTQSRSTVEDGASGSRLHLGSYSTAFTNTTPSCSIDMQSR